MHITPQNCSPTKNINGVEIIFNFLINTASLMQASSSSAHHKMMYDHTIFCLNILTNTVEMDPDRAKVMIGTIVVDEGFFSTKQSGKISGLSWLARWIVSTTAGFRESVMKGSFGTNVVSSSIDNELKPGEDDNLVVSGNGFVLLAYLMIGDDLSSRKIRDTILKEIPTDEEGVSGGIKFVVKVLKAFCNYYHFMVGDISVAVIAPVVKLISDLEMLDLQVVPNQNGND